MYIRTEHLVAMSNRLIRHLTSTCSEMSIRAEIPIFGRRDCRRMQGRIDVLFSNGRNTVTVNHKVYPGAFDIYEQKALGYEPQLGLYSSAVK